VLEHRGEIDSDSIYEYLSVGGYAAFEKALFEMSGDEMVKTVSDSKAPSACLRYLSASRPGMGARATASSCWSSPSR
jgi:hypothetical protein